MDIEIKFRVWEPQYKLMSDVTFIDFITNELDCKHNYGEPKSIEHFELMEYTGFKDKNKIPIFESDIVMTMSGSPGLIVRNKENRAWRIEFLDVVRYRQPYRDLISDADNDYLYCTYLKVIGNKFEYPELLKEKI